MRIVSNSLKAFALLLCLCVSFAAHAEQLPRHLAAFGSDLNRKLTNQISSYSGSKEEEASLEAAMRILRKAGVPQWSAQNIRIENGAEALAKPLGLDLSDAKQWGRLNQIVTAEDGDTRSKKIGELVPSQPTTKSADQESNEANQNHTAANEQKAEFDRVQSKLLENYSRRYGVKVGANGKLQVSWNPDGQTLRLAISGLVDEADPQSEFLVTMTGRVAPELVAKGNHIQFVVSADNPGISVVAPEQLKEMRASIFGEWKGGTEVWVISKNLGTGNSTNEQRQKESAESEIARAEEEISKLKTSKIFVWKDEDGDIIRQKKFKKLDDSHHYVGEQYEEENATARITELEKKIKDTKSTQKTKPVDKEDPLGRRYNPTGDEAQPLYINVTYDNGYTFPYRTAEFDGRRITADRTLYDRSDVSDLPLDVVDAAIASWSPPEWIELEVVPDQETNEITLEGVRWRMHVTYSYGAFGMGPLVIKALHTPYTLPMTLTRKGMKTAPGAAENAEW